ncbi:MAG: hypothetical protein JST00_26650 [Deltaproteobacteria bacterium]|nr:hypothetical protein [Deltaproteobacteria bacterium]
MPESPTIQKGRIFAYRVFDAGDTIALDDAEKRLGAKRVDMSGPLVEGLVVAARPLEVDLGTCKVRVAKIDREMEAHVVAHLFDYGAISLLYSFPIEPGTSIEALTPLCDALYDAAELDAIGAKHRAKLVSDLGPSVEKPHAWAEAETYTIVFAQEIAGCTLAELAVSPDVAKLLLGEVTDKPLSAAVRDDVLKNAFSYLADDLVVVDWNSALVVEPSGSRIVPFILELATTQLLEFRYYDHVLERELEKVYQHVERARPSIILSPYKDLMRGALRRYMELTEFTERVDNAIKSVGDFYLARVFLSAQRRFRVPEWRESALSKLGLVARAYELLKGDVEVSRAQLLEIIVVLLILIEVVAAMRGH